MDFYKEFTQILGIDDLKTLIELLSAKTSHDLKAWVPREV